jgi:hypothetical protein
VMLQAMLVCEAAVAAAAPPPQPPNSSTAGNANNSFSNSNGTQGAQAKGGGGREEGSATLMQYRSELPDVRVADERMTKDVLGLLFHLVQMQIRKAEKFREVRAAACMHALPATCMHMQVSCALFKSSID